jgi:hypothetical protein
MLQNGDWREFRRICEIRCLYPGLPERPGAALQALETVRCVEMRIADRTKLCVTGGSRQAAEALNILRLPTLDPSEPAKDQKGPMS